MTLSPHWSVTSDMEKEYQVKITPYALDQLREIVHYISTELQAPDTAKRWRERIKKELATLSYLPARIPLTEEEPWRSQGVHKMIVGNHFAYFWIDEANLIVWIIAVVYSRREQRTQLSQME